MTTSDDMDRLATPLRSMTPEALLALSKVLGYLHKEERHWHEAGQPDDHIWLSIRVLRDWLGLRETDYDTRQES